MSNPQESYLNAAVFEALAKDFLDGTFVLLFNDARHGSKDSEGTFPHTSIV
jgi:hypothetical protein